ncbi:MAG: helix-turn-helix domain-containing protein [Geodermatophilaceae bacterium]|nr:helix-turn-helix domain-containing protein [Geodermatophilaceae bacterium]
MDELLPWFRSMPADQRSWVTLVAHAGISSLVEWLRSPAGSRPQLTGPVFGAAPRELARSVSLKQTVDLVRATIDVVEERAHTLAAPGEEQALREGVLRFSREIAFAAAQVYATLAENRGAWDARLEALVVDALLRGDSDETLPSRAAALGWAALRPVTVVVGRAAASHTDDIHRALQRVARLHHAEVLAGVHGDLLIVVLGGVSDAQTLTRPLLAEFGPGPVVLGPTVDGLGVAGRSARAAMSGLRACAAWPQAPRPVHADDLLPERALAGDDDARAALVGQVYQALADGGPALLQTVETYVGSGGTLEGSARALFVHPNTVRYRLRRAADVCGQAPTDPRGAFTIRVALAYGHLADSAGL